MSERSLLPPKRKQSYNNYLKYSNLAIQMGAIIGIGAWGGTRLDRYFEFDTPVFTLCLTLVGVVLAIGLVVRSVLNERK